MKKLFAFSFCVLLVVTASYGSQDKINTARDLIRQDQAAEAISLLLPLADLNNPVQNEALVVLGMAYLKVGKPDSAEMYVESYLKTNGKNVEAYDVLSQAEADQEKFDEAYATLKKGMKSHKDNVRLLTRLAFIQLSQDSTTEAMTTFYHASSLEPDNPEIWRGLGETFLKQPGGVSNAIVQFEESIRLDSTQIDLKLKLADLYYQERRFNDQMRILNSMGDDDAMLKAGKTYFLAKQYSNAASKLGPYVRRNPEDIEVWSMYMEALFRDRQYASALGAADTLLAHNPTDAQALRIAAESHFFLKDYQQAIDCYHILGQVDTLGAGELKQIGKSYFLLKNDSMAIEYFEQALSKDPAQSDIYSDLGASYMRMKKWDKAADMYEKKFTHDSTYTSAYVNYALCMEQQSNWKASHRALKKALEMNPKHITSQYHLAYSLSRMDSTHAAKRAYDQVIALADTMRTRYKNELTDAYSYLTRYYLSEKKYPQALDAINSLLSFKPGDVELNLWRAQTLHALNKKDEAKKAYERVLQLDPNNKDAKKGIDILELYN